MDFHLSLEDTSSRPGEGMQLTLLHILGHPGVGPLILSLAGGKAKAALRSVSKTAKAAIDPTITKITGYNDSEISQLVGDEELPSFEVLLAARWNIKQASLSSDSNQNIFAKDKAKGDVSDLVWPSIEDLHFLDMNMFGGGKPTLLLNTSMPRLRSFSLHSSSMRGNPLKQWVSAPWWDGLEELKLSLPGEAAHDLAGWDVPALRSLSVNTFGRLSQPVLRKILGASWIPKLHSLSLSDKKGDVIDVSMLKHATAIKHLGLGSGDDVIFPADMSTLPWPPQLESLSISTPLSINSAMKLGAMDLPALKKFKWGIISNIWGTYEISVAARSLFRSATWLRQVETLELSKCITRPEDVAELQKKGGFPYLQSLDMCQCVLEEAGCKVLAQMEMPVLKELSLDGTSLEVGAVTALLEAPWITQLEKLDFRSCKMGNVAFKKVAKKELPNLKELLAPGNKLGDALLSLLVTAPWHTNLEELNLTSNKFSEAGIALLKKNFSEEVLVMNTSIDIFFRR